MQGEKVVAYGDIKISFDDDNDTKHVRTERKYIVRKGDRYTIKREDACGGYAIRSYLDMNKLEKIQPIVKTDKSKHWYQKNGFSLDYLAYPPSMKRHASRQFEICARFTYNLKATRDSIVTTRDGLNKLIGKKVATVLINHYLARKGDYVENLWTHPMRAGVVPMTPSAPPFSALTAENEDSSSETDAGTDTDTDEDRKARKSHRSKRSAS